MSFLNKSLIKTIFIIFFYKDILFARISNKKSFLSYFQFFIRVSFGHKKKDTEVIPCFIE